MGIPKPVEKVMDTLEQAGFEAWIVGGAVRDMLNNQTPHDYDIATSARPFEVKALFDHTASVGEAHGTILVVEDGMPIEVTTFRKDGAYEDHRHPEQVEFVNDILEDLKRRDFTINAMAWHPKRGLLDPFDGQKDLQDKKIRAVGDPAIRFQEDALRMIRAWRFAARLGFDVEEETAKAIEANARRIDDVAVERIVPELEEIMAANPEVIAHMTSLLKKWIPELEVMLHTEQNNKHHYTDVLHHTLDAMLLCPSKDPEVLWALLLHDTGKPATKTTNETGDHFTRHEKASAEIARRVVAEMKLPKKMQRDIPDLVLFHDSFYGPKLSNLYKIRIQRNWPDEKIQKLFEVQKGDILAHSSFDRMEPLKTFMDFYEKETKNRPLSLKDLAINGQDILDHTSLQGPQIQEALKKLLEHAFYHPQDNTREKLLERIDTLKAQPKQQAGKEKHS